MIITQFYKTNKHPGVSFLGTFSLTSRQWMSHSQKNVAQKLLHPTTSPVCSGQSHDALLEAINPERSKVSPVLRVQETCFKPCWWSLEPTALKLSLITQSWHYWFLSHNSTQLPSQPRKWATEDRAGEKLRKWGTLGGENAVKMQKKATFTD